MMKQLQEKALTLIQFLLLPLASLILSLLACRDYLWHYEQVRRGVDLSELNVSPAHWVVWFFGVTSLPTVLYLYGFAIRRTRIRNGLLDGDEQRCTIITSICTGVMILGIVTMAAFFIPNKASN